MKIENPLNSARFWSEASRKGLGLSLQQIVMIFLFMLLALAVVPMVVSGAETAGRAATSCPDWLGRISDISSGLQLC